MAVLSRRLSERLTGVAYQLGWKVICRVPQSWARWVFAEVAGIAWRRQGPKVQVLEANLRRVLSWKYGTVEVDGKELRALSRAALQSYARYWLEVFRLPVTPTERLVAGMRFQGPNEATLFAHLKAGRGVIIALPHMGNFEQAGAWVIARGAGKFTTVAGAAAARVGLRELRAVPAEPGLRGPAADRRRQPVRHPGPAAARPAAWSAWSATAT